MTSSRLVRGAKTRTIGCICLALLLGALVYLFQGTQTRLADVQKIANTCSQQAESLSAQLEVLFEYKLRLEKSLQNEKQEKKKAVEDYEKKLKIEKETREKDKTDFKEKNDKLEQDKGDLQMKLDKAMEDHESQLSNLNVENIDLKSTVKSLKENLDRVSGERDWLKTSNEKMRNEVEGLKKEVDEFKTKKLPVNDQIIRFENDKKELNEKLVKAEKELAVLKRSGNEVSPAPGSPSESNIPMPKPDDNKHALEPPSFNEEGDNGVVSKGTSSTTPGINPQAVYTQDSSAKTSTKQAHDSKPNPIEQPASINGVGPAAGLMGQIPVPPDDLPAASPNKASNHDDRMSNQIEWDDRRGDNMNAAIEEIAESPVQGEDDKSPRRDYPEKDYKEDQGDEDDDEEDRMGDQSPLRRQSQLNKFSDIDMPDGGGGGIMLNPK